MELLEEIKTNQKKKRIAIGVIATVVVSVAIAAVALMNRDGETNVVPQDDEKGSTVSVFKTAETTEATDKATSQDTAEPIDLTGINGLLYVSKGDGTCYVNGIGSCENTELKIPSYSPSGDLVTKISDGAFLNCTQLLSVSIPATVKSIGVGAFRGCSSLVAINVDTENSVYCSVGGVLLSKDKTILICLPMNRPGTSYLLSTDIKAIAAYAFEGVLNLKSILYEGGISDFSKIEVLMGNGILNELQITCNYVSSK